MRINIKGEKTGRASTSSQHSFAKSMNKKVYFFQTQEEQKIKCYLNTYIHERQFGSDQQTTRSLNHFSQGF